MKNFIKKIKKNEVTIPRTIWMLWFQGFDNAPEVVKKCYASWKKYNPDWDIKFLEEPDIREYLNVSDILKANQNNVTIQFLSDVIRINLLAKYGGVWVDATCFCCQPLDDWLHTAAPSGFFAFDKPYRDRHIDNWFLASHKDCLLTKKLSEKVNQYFSSNTFSDDDDKPELTLLFKRLLNRNTYLTRFWFSFFVTKVFKIHPYFGFHYLFSEVIRENRECRETWEQTKKMSAITPHKLQLGGLFDPISEESKQHIDTKQSPVYKLCWNFPSSWYGKKGLTLDYILNSL